MAKEAKVKINDWFRNHMNNKLDLSLDLDELIVYTYKYFEMYGVAISPKFSDIICVYTKGQDVRYINLDNLVREMGSSVPTVRSVTPVKRGEITTFRRVLHVVSVDKSDKSFFHKLEKLDIKFVPIYELRDIHLEALLEVK